MNALPEVRKAHPHTQPDTPAELREVVVFLGGLLCVSVEDEVIKECGLSGGLSADRCGVCKMRLFLVVSQNSFWSRPVLHTMASAGHVASLARRAMASRASARLTLPQLRSTSTSAQMALQSGWCPAASSSAGIAQQAVATAPKLTVSCASAISATQRGVRFFSSEKALGDAPADDPSAKGQQPDASQDATPSEKSSFTTATTSTSSGACSSEGVCG